MSTPELSNLSTGRIVDGHVVLATPPPGRHRRRPSILAKVVRARAAEAARDHLILEPVRHWPRWRRMVYLATPARRRPGILATYRYPRWLVVAYWVSLLVAAPTLLFWR